MTGSPLLLQARKRSEIEYGLPRPRMSSAAAACGGCALSEEELDLAVAEQGGEVHNLNPGIAIFTCLDFM